MKKGKGPIFPRLPRRIGGLTELATNLWWSWHPEARMLFKTLDRQAWKESQHNPVKMLKEMPQEILKSATQDSHWLRHYDLVLAQFRKDVETKESWSVYDVDVSSPHAIAYFSAEYGLHHSLPFYAGGLGFLAGDHIKECSDLRIPLVAIGFMYPEGYVRQRIRDDGWQDSMDQVLDREVASISRVFTEDGEQLLVRVPLIEPPIYVAVWQVSAGRVPLYLMDTDIEANDPASRSISARLYAGDLHEKLRQAIVLGIGGSEVLDRLGITHSVLHFIRSTSIFTTHTPVPAGHHVFPFDLIDKYFHTYWQTLGLDRDAFLQLGVDPRQPDAGFNMTVFALRMSGYRNAVSKRHREVAQRMWSSLWPDLPERKIPIDYVTNGVHVPTWIEPKMELLFNEYLGPNWRSDHDNPLIWEMVAEIPDEQLWRTHYWLKMKLINIIRERARHLFVRERAGSSVVIAGGTLLDPSILTLGFARRFATYKRADLILYDIERLKGLLNDRWRPIQIIFAGKAHPADDPAKQILQRIYNAARDPEFGGHIAFVEDYGEQLAQYLVHGVDVWLNNPLPPMEACGTSGMKAALNGVLHLSIKDGWWVEGFNGKNGWAFGDEGDDRNSADAQSIYDILEEEVIPIYYRISEDGVPHDWVSFMKESIKSNAPKFSARRMVKEYAEKFYRVALKKA